MAAPHPALLCLIRGEDFPTGFRVTMPIVESAVEHGVAPLLDEAVRRQHIDGHHDALVHLTMRSLESAADTNAALNALDVLLDVSDSLGVDIAIFKGLAIGSRWYPSPELRPACDIDVFVDPDRTDRLGELVERFAPNPGSRKTVEGMVAEGRVFEYSLVVDGAAVDLHIDPMNLVVPTRQQRLLWERIEVIPISDGRVVRTLDLELSLIQALLHLLRDDFADLLHVYDIGLMIDAEPDWDFVEAFAAAEGWTDLVRFSLGVVCDTMNRPSPLPRNLTAVNRALAAALWPVRIRFRGADRFFAGAHRQSMTSLLITGRRRDVARALTRRVLPPRNVIDDRYGACDSPYPIALYRWRRAQRAEIKQMSATATAGVSHETI